jgi:CHAT domain-containing protein
MGKITTFLLIFFSMPLYAQMDSLQAEHFIVKAKSCLQNGAADSSIYYIEGARKFFKKNDQLAPWLKTYSALAYVLSSDLDQTGNAVELVEQGLREKWREPNSPKEWEQLTMTLLAAGHVLRMDAGDYIGAKSYFEKAQNVFFSKLGEHSDRVARYLYHNLGNIYTRIGDYERAISLFRRSLNYSQLYPEAKLSDHGDLAIALNEVGLHEEALRVVQQGLSLKDLASDYKIGLFLNEADALLKLGQPVQGMVSLEKIPILITQMVAEQGDLDEQNYLSQYHATKAEILVAQNQNVQAQIHCHKAIEAGKKHWGTEKRREIGKVYDLLGTLKLAQKQPREALAYFHHALFCVLPGLTLNDITQAPSSATFYSENTILEALQGKARAFQTLNQLEKALECYELIPFVEAKLRATHAYESSSLLALKESRQRFQDAIDLAWQLFEQSNGNPKYAERAFRLTELARGMLLLQSLVQARQYLPTDIREKDYDLRVRMAWLEHEIAAEREKGESLDQKKIEIWENQLFDLKLERQKLLADFPSYNNPDSLFLQVLAAKDVRSLLRPGQAMVDFFLTEKTAYIFSFDTNGDFRWRKATLPEGFREQTKQFAGYLWAGEEAGRAAFLQKAWMLDSLLIAPERKRWGVATTSLMIVPDDVLMLVPFDVLISSPAAEKSTWRDQRWLLVDYSLGYTYSATLLNIQKSISETHAKAVSKPPQVFGGFAPSYTQASAYKLENTRPMTENVCDLLGGKAWLGSASSESCFKNSAANYRTLLLAMHGISDNEHPELSRLLFGDPGPDSLINNNILYASELQIMQLQADLVVLSACHSGSGKLEQGEGVYSLARAFAAAGVPASVMSLWLLHENSAPPLVEAFFKYLQQGKTKDEALKLAKFDFLKNDANFEMTHPFFWAGLTASGDMRSLDLPQNPAFSNTFWAVFGVLGFVFLGICWWWYRKKKA